MLSLGLLEHCTYMVHRHDIHSDIILNSLKIEIKSFLKKEKKFLTKSPRARWIQYRILPGIQRKDNSKIL